MSSKARESKYQWTRDRVERGCIWVKLNCLNSSLLGATGPFGNDTETRNLDVA